MMRYFVFNFLDKEGTSTTVIFDHWRELSESIIEDLKEFHTYKEQCHNTIYIYPNNRKETTEETRRFIANYSNKKETAVKVWGFGKAGLIGNECEAQQVFHHGLLTIIKERNAILESDDNFHYVLPSEKHSPFFIRTANILVRSPEVNFLALSLMTLVKVESFTNIACDTSSIIAIPYAVNYLLGLFGSQLEAPYMSFGSYNSLDDFEFKANSLVLISASNSGHLEHLIETKQKDLTIISVILNRSNRDRKALINIHDHLPSLVNIKSTKQFSSSLECEYCHKNSIAVIVRGEQFIPSRVLIQRILVHKFHVPPWITSAAKIIVEKKAVHVNRRETASSKRREIFIDMQLLMDDEEFVKAVDRYVSNFIPANITQLVYVKDSGSQKVAERIQSHFQALGRTLPAPIPHTRLSHLDNHRPHSLLIVSGCTTTGNKLNSVSRDLRDFQFSSIHYLTIISRLETESKHDTLVKNLEYISKEKKEHVHKFHTVFKWSLGDYHDGLFTRFEKPPWTVEADFWSTLRDIPEVIQRRLKLLEHERGLINDLFFDNPFPKSDPKLRLRKNFAFYDFNDIRSVSQADVYFIISGIFHSLRHPHNVPSAKIKDKPKFLLQHEHVRSILDPECFKRYNDGIIQACFLRCARPSEINYGTSERDSREMLETLKDMFKGGSSPESKEALLEFLYAIAIGKLRLQEPHKQEFLSLIKSEHQSISIVSYFLELCENKMLEKI